MEKDFTVFGTTVTVPFLQKKLRSVLNTKCVFGPNFRMQRIGDKQGFLSITARIFFDWQGSGKNLLPESLVIKIPSTDYLVTNIRYSTLEELQEQQDRLEAIVKVGHGSETAFYRLAKRGRKLMDLLIPDCIYSQPFNRSGSQKGLLLIEDLCEIGAVKSIYTSLSSGAIKAVLQQLANLHAYSLVERKWRLGADKILRSTFFEVQQAFPFATRQRIYRAIDSLHQKYGSYFIGADGQTSLLDELAEVVDDQLTFQNGSLVHQELGMVSVLTHGDMWSNNILWQKIPGTTDETYDEVVAIIDWQNAHAGNVAEDFVRFFGSSVDPDIRRKELDSFIQYYHGCLVRKLYEQGCYRIPYSVEEIKHAFERLLGQGLLIMLPSLNGHADENTGLLGVENVQEKKLRILYRCRCLIEDFLEIRRKLENEENESIGFAHVYAENFVNTTR